MPTRSETPPGIEVAHTLTTTKVRRLTGHETTTTIRLNRHDRPGLNTAAMTEQPREPSVKNRHPHEDVERLAALFIGVVKAQFAASAGISPSMIAHHLSGRRPISLSDAVKYAKGFGVTLEEISPAHARLVVTAYALTKHHHSGRRISQTRAASQLVDA